MYKLIVVYLYNGILLNNKKNEMLIDATTWMNFKTTMLNERSQTEKNVSLCMIPFTYNSREWKQF